MADTDPTIPQLLPVRDEAAYLTVREMVTEIRADLKALRQDVALKSTTDDHEVRLRNLEGVRLQLRGAWVTLGVSASAIAGVTGLALGIYTAL